MWVFYSFDIRLSRRSLNVFFRFSNKSGCYCWVSDHQNRNWFWVRISKSNSYGRSWSNFSSSVSSWGGYRQIVGLFLCTHSRSSWANLPSSRPLWSCLRKFKDFLRVVSIRRSWRNLPASITLWCRSRKVELFLFANSRCSWAYLSTIISFWSGNRKIKFFLFNRLCLLYRSSDRFFNFFLI